MIRLLAILLLAVPGLGVAAEAEAHARAKTAAQARMLQDLAAAHPQLVERMDADGDGRWSAAELQTMRGFRLQPFFAASDRDGDGAVSPGELARAAAASNVVTTRRTIALPGTGRAMRAHAVFGQQRASIRDYDVVGDNYDPQVSVLGTGTVLDVGPVTVRDRP